MAAAPSDEVQVESATRRPVRVVTVDDQPFFRTAARAIVDSTPGFELVGESADGESARELVPRLDPDIVILDVRMPGIDGIDVADRLHREDPARGSDEEAETETSYGEHESSSRRTRKEAFGRELH